MTSTLNINSRFLVLAWIGLWSALIAVTALVSSGCSSARADTDKTVRAPEVYLIGERVTYVEDGITVTVEPGVLVLYN